MKKFFSVLTPLFLLLFLYSCGNSQDGTSVGEKSAKPVISVGRVICGGHLSLAVVGKKFQGDLEDFTLDAVQYHDWKIVVKDMKSGKLSGTFILSPLAMDLIKNGFPGKIILMGDRNGNGFVLSKDIAAIKDLKGRKSVIAVPHLFSQHNVLFHLALKQNGVPLEDVSVVGMPPRDMIGSLKRGEIDGFVVGEPEGNKSSSLNVGHLVAISPDIWKGHMDHVFLATDRFISEEPGKVARLVKALYKGGRFIEANPAEAAKMGEDYTGSSAKVFEEVLTTPPDWIDYSDMLPTKKDFEDFSATLVEMGLWNEAPEKFTDFFDTSFIEKAMPSEIAKR